MRTNPVDWAAARSALAEEVTRVSKLLRSVDDPHAAAVGQWNVVEVAVHLCQAFVIVPGLASADLTEALEFVPGLAQRGTGSLMGDIWDLGDLTVEGVRRERERDLHALAERVDASAAAFLADTAETAPDEARSWLVDGVTVDVPTLTCHLLNETVVHGYDIAVASGRRWRIDRGHAALVVDGFVFPLVDALGNALVDASRAAGLRACYAVHVRGGGRHVMTFDDGTLTVGPRNGRRVDCHLSVDPAAFLLVVWGRRSQWRAIATGQLVAWGRRPWLGPRLRQLVRNV